MVISFCIFSTRNIVVCPKLKSCGVPKLLLSSRVEAEKVKKGGSSALLLQILSIKIIITHVKKTL